MDGRDLVVGGDLRQRLAHKLNQRRTIFASRSEKPVAGHRSERNAHEHFRIILDPGMVRRLGPFIIEHELAHAVELQIHRAGGDQLAAVLDDDVVRQPAGLAR